MQEQKTDDNKSNILLIVFVVISFITVAGNFVIQVIFDDWYIELKTKYFVVFLLILANASYILPALAIKDKILKIIGIILTSIIIMLSFYQNIMFMLSR